MDLTKYIRVQEGFPKEGISFKDVTPLLADKDAFAYVVSQMAKDIKAAGADYVIGPESRGFLFGAPAALEAGIGFVMARKKGKLPGETVAIHYELEYGQATIELPKMYLHKGDKVVIVDDLLATGGTLKAVIDGLKECGVEVVLAICLIELTDLKGKDILGVPFVSYIKYPH